MYSDTTLDVSLPEITQAFWSNFKSNSNNFSFSNLISNQDVMRRIEIVTLDVINQLNTTGNIELTFINNPKSASYDPCTNMNRIQSIQKTTLRTPQSYKTIAHIIKVLEISYEHLKNGTKICKRGIFYSAQDVFDSQKSSDKALEYACSLLEIPRNRLNILASSKGLIVGCISFCESGSLTEARSQSKAIPFDIDCVSDIQTNAEYILVVEKDTVLEELRSKGLFDELPIVGITGRGYPDLSTREFIRRILNEFSSIPVLVLTDFDPHGFKILCTYTFGSMKMASECDTLAIPIAHWLGVHFGEGRNGMPLRNNDRKLLEKLLVLPQINMGMETYQDRRFGMWKEQLEEMRRSGRKCEVENVENLKEFLKEKIKMQRWI